MTISSGAGDGVVVAVSVIGPHVPAVDADATARRLVAVDSDVAAPPAEQEAFMIVRLRDSVDVTEQWFHNVISASSDRGRLTLYLPYAPWCIFCRHQG